MIQGKTMFCSGDDGVATIVLNRPDVHNAFDEHMIAELSDCLDRVRAAEDIYAVVLRGEGPSFCTGADLNWMRRAADYTEAQNRADAQALAYMLNKLYTLPQVTIAQVHGAAMGGGLGLVACCDIGLAHANTVFALSEVRLGLIPATISPYVLHAIGDRQARRYFQTGEKFNAETARAIGLVHEITDDVNVILDALKRNGPNAMRASKKLCMDFSGKGISHDIISDSVHRIAYQRTLAEFKDRAARYLESKT